MKKVQRPIHEIIAELLSWYKHSGHSQAELSRLTKVNQSTVSRLLSPNTPRKHVTQALSKLCNYAKIDIYLTTTSNPASNKTLMDALESTWDGTPSHARRLAKIIRQLKSL